MTGFLKMQRHADCLYLLTGVFYWLAAVIAWEAI